MMQKTRIAAAVMLALPGLSIAAETALDAVVVTAAGYEQKVVQAPASVSVIEREALQKGAYDDVRDAVRQLAGVSIVGGNGTQDISLRGLPGDYTLFMVDGRRQSTRETMNRGTAGVQSSLLPPLEAIERIEVVRGPMSSLYGADAMGGVINIITRKEARAWHGTLSLDSVTNGDAAAGNSRGAGFWLGGPLVEGVASLQLSGRIDRRQEDDQYVVNTGPNSVSKNAVTYTAGNPATDTTVLGAKLTLTPVAGQVITAEAGLDMLEYRIKPGKSIPQGEDAEDTLNNRTFYALTHEGSFGFGKTRVALHQERGSQEALIPASDEGSLVRASEPQIVNTLLDGMVTLGGFDAHVLKAGLQLGRQDLSGIGQEAAVPGHAANLDATHADTWAVFGEDQYAVTDALTLTAGLRNDHHSLYGDHLSPRLYGVYALAPQWTLRGGVSRGFKAPTLRQTSQAYCMTTGTPSSRGSLCGNPSLKPEESTSTEFGVRFDAQDGRQFSAMLFANDLKNKVISYDTGAKDPLNPKLKIYQYGNIDKVRIYGVELNGVLPLTRSLKLSGNYTFTDSRRQGSTETAFDGSSLDGQPLEMTPRHMANAVLDWTLGDAVSTYARVSYTGEQTWAALRNGAMGVRHRPATTTFDLGGNWAVTKQWSVKAAVLNVLDKRLDVDARGRYDGRDGNWMFDEGRRLWLGATLTF